MRDHATESIVQLWTAPLPYVGSIAEHHWLEIVHPTQTDRWEVWQRADQGGESWGHVHRNLLAPREGVGNGPARMLFQWESEMANALVHRIESSPTVYPWRHWYRIVPGPNSNTFVQWVLEDRYQLGWRGIGRGYARRANR